MLFFSSLPSIVKGQLFLRNDLPIRYLLYDSRKGFKSNASVFFAIVSGRRDAHVYIPALYNEGIRQFIIQQGNENLISTLPEANFFVVEDTVTALQGLVVFHRAAFHFPVIGITGSNGKTIVKEWLSMLLSSDYSIVKNPRSFNSQIGVPLSVWEMEENHTLGIFEAGISKPKEMAKLESVIQPNIGVLTNIGTAHDEGFPDRPTKISEKLKLFTCCSHLIFNADDLDLAAQIKATLPKVQLLSWGSENASIIVKRTSGNKSTLLFIEYLGETFSLSIPFIDAASIQNVIHCIAVLLLLKVPYKEIAVRIATLRPLKMRLELKDAINGCFLIDDSYNNDLVGLSTALDFLGQQKQLDSKTLILSDVLESGVDASILYKKIAALAEDKNICKVVGIGPEISKHKASFNMPGKFYENTEAFLEDFDLRETFSKEIILLKGARRFRFEQIARKLSAKVHGTVLEVNLDALIHNLNFYRSKLNPSTKVMVMVKAFAYGSGSAEVANLLQFHKVDYLAVAYADEGVELRKNGVSLPIMVMNPDLQTFEVLSRYNLEPEIYNFKLLHAYSQFVLGLKKPSKIHLKLDTGMHRLGFIENELDALFPLLNSNPLLVVQSVFTHLAGADDSKFNEFSMAQITAFKKMALCLEQALSKSFLKHVLNSAGIIRFPNDQMDMVRLGIGLYGVEATGLAQKQLATVGTLKSVISQIKVVLPGETVGYSRNGKVEIPKKIATVAIGYADGYDRRFGNGVGKMLIDSKLCTVIGNVCMDMCMVDISATDAREGDEVLIFGQDPSILNLAASIDTIPYEILTNVSERVKRIFYTE